MKVEEIGLLKSRNFRREIQVNEQLFEIVSTFNQPLFIGPQMDKCLLRPSPVFVKLHELLARILHMTSGAEEYQRGF
jgi:hypothetical protein